MQGFYSHKTIDATFATDTTVTTAIKVLGANRVVLEMPTYAVGASSALVYTWVEGSNTSTTSTFRPIHAQGVYSAASGIHQWQLPTGAGNFMAVCDAALGFKYVRFWMDVTATANVLAKVHVMQ